ncbi:Type 1 glutamine amidotransferase-like domain-containing protein [Virgibacillus siamensis]|uniref:Type 1 glutamine amidotransferase-like domain-containing protein n=2 Tax=Virgibacillus siamensis TaxID=480071 RepID=A0ABN1GM11_9BACI
MEPDNMLLDTYILRQSNKATPKICFVPTASGDADSYIARFYDFFRKQSCVPSHLSLFKPPVRDLQRYILDKDIIYVGGGNTKNLLALWREWGLDIILKKAWEQGVILAGISAGSICWFEQGVTDSYGDELEPIDCLGFLKGSNCPHYDGEPNRRPTYQNFIKEKQIQSGIAADDGVAIHYAGQKIHHIVSSRVDAKAYILGNHVDLSEKEVQPYFLGSELY